MARYCFYCNKELQPGQRCDCRYSQKIQATESNGATGTNATAPDDDGTRPDIPPAADDDAQAKREARRAARERRKTERNKQKSSDNSRRSKRRTNANTNARRSEFQRAGHRNGVFKQFYTVLLNFFRDPIHAIGHSNEVSPRLIMALIGFEAVFSGLFVYNAVRLDSIGRFLMFTTFRFDGLDRLFMFTLFFLGGALIALTQYFVRAFTFKATARFWVKQVHTTKEILVTLLPGTVYNLLFLIVGSFTAAGTGIGAVVLLAAGLAIRGMLDFPAWRNLTGQEEGQAILQVAAITLFQCMVFGALMGALLPSITNFYL